MHGAAASLLLLTRIVRIDAGNNCPADAVQRGKGAEMECCLCRVSAAYGCKALWQLHADIAGMHVLQSADSSRLWTLDKSLMRPHVITT